MNFIYRNLPEDSRNPSRNPSFEEIVLSSLETSRNLEGTNFINSRKVSENSRNQTGTLNFYCRNSSEDSRNPAGTQQEL